MARPPAVRVWRSGDLYLVAHGALGRLVPTDGRPPYGVADLQSIVAHCNVQDPWEPVALDALPDAVAKILSDF